MSRATDGDADADVTLPTDRELAEYFRHARDADDPETWVEYFDLENARQRDQENLDDRVRDFWMEHLKLNM